MFFRGGQRGGKMYQLIRDVNPYSVVVTLSCGHQITMKTITEAVQNRKQWCDICQKQNENQKAKDTSAPSGGQKVSLPQFTKVNPHMNFERIIQQMLKVHISKGEDYAVPGNKFSNFEQAAVFNSMFSDPVDRVFATIIGIKLSRLAVLKNSGKTPNNESIADTHLDLNVYAVLWHEYTELQTIKLQEKTPIGGSLSYGFTPDIGGRVMREMSEKEAGNSEKIQGETQTKAEDKKSSGGVNYNPQKP